MPKTLKRLKFQLEAVPEIINKPIEEPIKVPVKEKKKELKKEPIVLENDNYRVPDSVIAWKDKFRVCDELIQEAKKRNESISVELSDIDKKICNAYHVIEFTKKIDMYNAWMTYKSLHELLVHRRALKDEKIIPLKILRTDFGSISKKTIERSIDGLSKRKFTFRIVEEDDNNGEMPDM